MTSRTILIFIPILLFFAALAVTAVWTERRRSREKEKQRFADEYFVDVMPAGSTPETRSVRGSNFLRLAVHRPGNGDLIIVLAVEDNLVKGAAGQSVQAMNILFGLDEKTGLDAPALVP